MGCNGVHLDYVELINSYIYNSIYYSTIYVWRVGFQQALLLHPCMVVLGCDRV